MFGPTIRIARAFHVFTDRDSRIDFAAGQIVPWRDLPAGQRASDWAAKGLAVPSLWLSVCRLFGL